MKMYSSTSSPRNLSRICASMGLPATLMSGLGLVYVCGRKRVPSPAKGMMTFMFNLFHGCGMYFFVVFNFRDFAKWQPPPSAHHALLTALIIGLRLCHSVACS